MNWKPSGLQINKHEFRPAGGGTLNFEILDDLGVPPKITNLILTKGKTHMRMDVLERKATHIGEGTEYMRGFRNIEQVDIVVFQQAVELLDAMSTALSTLDAETHNKVITLALDELKRKNAATKSFPLGRGE